MDIGRISRALTQPLFLIHTLRNGKYILSGMTSCYDVQLPECSELCDGKVERYDDEKLLQTYPLTECKLNNVTCTCPDFQNRHRACKHVFFILLKVLKIRCDVNLRSVLRGNNRGSTSWQYSRRSNITRVVRNVESVLNHTSPENSKGNLDCSICLDDFVEESAEESKSCAFCHGCGYKFHSVCLSVWIKTQKTRKKSCPLCRHAFN